MGKDNTKKGRCIKNLNRILAVAIIATGVYYVTVANDLMAKGFELQELKQEKQSLERVNKQLNSRVTSLRSYSNLASRTGKLNMVSADNIDYITAGRSMMAKK
jgi:conjugal transfer/entry exclusion protein